MKSRESKIFKRKELASDVETNLVADEGKVVSLEKETKTELGKKQNFYYFHNQKTSLFL